VRTVRAPLSCAAGVAAPARRPARPRARPPPGVARARRRQQLGQVEPLGEHRDQQAALGHVGERPVGRAHGLARERPLSQKAMARSPSPSTTA